MHLCDWLTHLHFCEPNLKVNQVMGISEPVSDTYFHPIHQLTEIPQTTVRMTVYAVKRWGLRCRYNFSNHSAVLFVYRYVV
jgi:hypothetical protein